MCVARAFYRRFSVGATEKERKGKERNGKEMKKEQEKLNILNSLLNLYTKLEVQRVKCPPRFKC
jgi:hypothetical protein